MVLVHGAGGQARDWPAEWRYRTNAAQALGVPRVASAPTLARHPVYALDLPGHGASDGPACTSVEAMADAVAAFIEAIGLKRVVVGGHSMGGAIALTLAARKPTWLAGLVIVGSAARLPVTDQILDGLRTDFAATCDFITRYSWHRDTPAVWRETARRRLKATPAEVVHADFAACAGYDAVPMLATISVPVLVVSAAQDRMVPPERSASLAEALPNARLQAVEGAGHFLHVERTAEVGRAIEAFMTSLG